MPKAAALAASDSAAVCFDRGVEMAQALLTQQKTTGALSTPAKLAAS
jgi:hypothetical protein